MDPVFRDMRHPHKFNHALTISYGITFCLDFGMGVVGYLMFGKYVSEEVPPPNTPLALLGRS